jgi:hypothetical protein
MTADGLADNKREWTLCDDHKPYFGPMTGKREVIPR